MTSDAATAARQAALVADFSDIIYILQRELPDWEAPLRKAGIDFERVDRVEPLAAILNSRSDVQLAVSLCLMRLGYFADARRLLSEVRPGQPQHLPALRALAVALAGDGHFDEAIATHETILDTRPSDQVSRNSILRVLHDGDRPHALLTRAFAALHRNFLRERPGVAFKVSRASDLVTWQKKNPDSLSELEPACAVDHPSGLTPLGGPYVAEAITFAEIPGATIVPGWDFVVTSAGEVLDGSGYLPLSVQLNAMPHFLDRAARHVVHPWPAHEDVVDDAVLLLGSPVVPNVGHWICDFLPRLRYAAGNPALKLAVPAPLRARYREFLHAFGIDEQRLLLCDPSRRYRFKSLIAMTAVDHNRPHPNTIAFLRTHLGPAGPSTARRIFLERAPDSYGRQIVNRFAFDAVCGEFGIGAVRLDQLSLDEQSRILGGARLVIASRGAELASIFQLPSGCRVIVMVPTHDPDVSPLDADLHQFERYAAALGIHISWLACAPPDPNTKAFNQNFVVDLDRARALLRAAA